MKRSALIIRFGAALAVALVGCSSSSSPGEEVEESQPFALESTFAARPSHEVVGGDAGSAHAAKHPLPTHGYSGPHPEPWHDPFGPHPEPWTGEGTLTPRPGPSTPKEANGGGSPSSKR